MVKNINVDSISSIHVKVKCKDDTNAYLLYNFKYVFLSRHFVSEKKTTTKIAEDF